MNPELQALEKMLQMGLKSKADLAGLDEQHATAKALRDTPDYKGNSRGQQSIFGHLANTVQKNTGKRQLKELAGQREAARANVAKSDSALPMFKLNQEQKALKLAADIRKEDLAKENNKLEYERGGFTGITPMWTAEGVEVQVGMDDRNLPVDTNTGERLDISQLLSVNPSITKNEELKARATADRGGLTENQMNIRLKDYRKAIDPVVPVVNAVKELDGMLMGLDDANKSIPGIGVVEGGSGTMSQLARLASGQDAQNIHAACTYQPLERQPVKLPQNKHIKNRLTPIDCIMDYHRGRLLQQRNGIYGR